MYGAGEESTILFSSGPVLAYHHQRLATTKLPGRRPAQPPSSLNGRIPGLPAATSQTLALSKGVTLFFFSVSDRLAAHHSLLVTAFCCSLAASERRQAFSLLIRSRRATPHGDPPTAPVGRCGPSLPEPRRPAVVAFENARPPACSDTSNPGWVCELTIASPTRLRSARPAGPVSDAIAATETLFSPVPSTLDDARGPSARRRAPCAIACRPRQHRQPPTRSKTLTTTSIVGKERKKRK